MHYKLHYMILSILTSIDARYNITRDIVGSDYVVTIPAVYNTLLGESSALTLVYGEHLDQVDYSTTQPSV